MRHNISTNTVIQSPRVSVIAQQTAFVKKRENETQTINGAIEDQTKV